MEKSGSLYFEHNFIPLKAKLNPICRLLTLLRAHHIFHVSGLRVKCIQFLKFRTPVFHLCHFPSIVIPVRCLMTFHTPTQSQDGISCESVLKDAWLPLRTASLGTHLS
jgi:hypothetical protein